MLPTRIAGAWPSGICRYGYSGTTFEDGKRQEVRTGNDRSLSNIVQSFIDIYDYRAAYFIIAFGQEGDITWYSETYFDG